MSNQTRHAFPPIRKQLENGATLPAAWYTDPSILDEERRRIFKKTWQYVGLRVQLAKSGDFFTARIAGVPIVLVRTESGTIKGYVNICPHRLTEVAYGCGNAKLLQCPYHGWTFGLDGGLRNAPDCQDEENFDKAALGLRPIAVGIWGVFVFVNLDTGAAPLADDLKETNEILRAHGIDIDRLVAGKRTPFDVAANWKILAENYLECYHCPIAHKGFSKIFDVSAEHYRLDVIGRQLISRGPLRSAPPGGFQEKHGYQPVGPVTESIWILLWPNLTINILPGAKNISFYYFFPDTTGRTTAAFQYFYPPDYDENVTKGLEGFWDSVGYEDMALVESVQRSVESGAIETGRLVLKREKLIQAFQLLTHDALAPEPALATNSN